MDEVARNCMSVSSTTMESNMVLIVQVVHAMNGIVNRTIRIILAAGPIANMELWRVAPITILGALLIARSTWSLAAIRLDAN